jgi:hypothetical protein
VIEVVIGRQYGNVVMLPGNAEAIALCDIAGRKSLSHSMLVYAERLGQVAVADGSKADVANFNAAMSYLRARMA